MNTEGKFGRNFSDIILCCEKEKKFHLIPQLNHQLEEKSVTERQTHSQEKSTEHF